MNRLMRWCVPDRALRLISATRPPAYGGVLLQLLDEKFHPARFGFTAEDWGPAETIR